MSFREVPADQRQDAEVLAALLGLVPTREGDRILLLSRTEIMEKVEELRRAGEDEGAYSLLHDLEFDAPAAFQSLYTQVASKSVRLQTATLFRLLKGMSETGESRGDIMRRLLYPYVIEALSDVEDRVSEEHMDMLRFSLDRWRSGGRASSEEDELEAPAQKGPGPLPALRMRLGNDRLRPDLRKFSRYFLKNLFRLNNIHGSNEFFHPPEIIERYWEVVSPNQGVFHAEMVPSSNSLTVRVFDPVRCFGLERTENPDYFGLVEFLAIEQREDRIKGCRIDLHGRTVDDEVILQEMMSIESEVDGDPLSCSVRRPHQLSTDGLEAFRRRIRQLTGVQAEVRFPVNEGTPSGGLDDYSVLGFDLTLDHTGKRFLLDGAEVSERSMHEVVLAVGGKLLDLSRHVYRDPAHFPKPDIEELDREIHRLIGKAEEEGLSEERAMEIVAKITVLDYYEGLAKYSYALSEQLLDYLNGTQVVTFTIPRVLLALLDRVLEERGIDDLILANLKEDGA